MTDPAAARLNMVDSQLRTNKVVDEAVLEAFLAVPRERFVPPPLRGTAYVDEDIPLGGGRFLMEPMVLARLIQLARIGRGDTVLEVGAATGYATALLARLAKRVVALEGDPKLAQQARARLAELGAANATVVEGPLAAGHAAAAPYQAILVNGAVAAVPPAIAAALDEGGRLVTVLRPPGQVGQAILATKAGSALSQRP